MVHADDNIHRLTGHRWLASAEVFSREAELNIIRCRVATEESGTNMAAPSAPDLMRNADSCTGLIWRYEKLLGHATRDPSKAISMVVLQGSRCD